MTGRRESRTREAEEVLPLQALKASDKAYDHTEPSQTPYQRAGYVSYALKADGNRRQLTTVYGSIPTGNNSTRKNNNSPLAPRLTEADALLGGSDQHSNQSETESDSDGSCTASTSASLQSILRIPSANFSCRSLKKQASVEFALDIDSDEDEDTKQRLDGSCATRCMPRRLTIEEKADLYRVRPDLELVPTVLLLSELEEMRRQRQRKLMFSILGASLILFMMIVFYYLVSQM